MFPWYGWRRWQGCGPPATWAGWAWRATACSASSASTVAEAGLLGGCLRRFDRGWLVAQPSLGLGTGLAGDAGILEATAQPQAKAQHQQGAQYPQLVFLDAAEHPFQHRAKVVGRLPQCRGPDRRANTVEDQVAQRWIAGQANRHGHHRAQAVDEAETQYPDIRMLADMFQRLVAHQLPARLARQQLAAVLAPHVVPELVAGVAAKKGNDHHQVDIHVATERQEACEYKDGLAFEERAEKEGKVAEVMQ